MELTSLAFFLFVLVGLLLVHLREEPAYRAAIFALLNGVFIASYVSDWSQLAPLAGFLLLGYGAAEAVRRWPGRAVQIAAIAAVLVLYVFLKRFSFLDGVAALPFAYLIIGLSYILFRILHLVFEAPAAPRRVGAIEYFNYTCNFLTFISGPIQKFEDFRNSYRHGPVGAETAAAAFSRVATGLFKVLVLSGAANLAFLALEGQVTVPQAGWAAYGVLYAVTVVAYTLYLYFNFSGYMDIVIGVGWLFGQALPENFDRPFKAQSFLEFWQRWHMTLSDWFRLYLFNPLLKALVGRVPDPRFTATLGVVAFFVTFLVMGVWHGTTAVFVIYGLTMGAGASVNKLWQLAMTKALGRKRYQAVGARPLYGYVARGVTFAYFALGVTCLWVDLAELQAIAAKLGIAGWIVVFAGLSAAAALSMMALDTAEAMLAAAYARFTVLAQSWFASNAWLAARIVTIAIVTSFFHKAPEFVYKAF